MTSERTHDPILWSTLAIAFLLTITAVAGIYWPATYAREISRDGGLASDIVDLFLVLPILLISGIKGCRGSLPARLVWLGTLGYLLYNFVIYTLGVHFNGLFLVYCATMGLCFYAATFSVRSIPVGQVAETYGPRAPRRAIAIVFLWIALATASTYLREDIPAILTGRVPQSVTEMNLPVNFIHVLDLVFLLPALCITATLLFRRKAAGYVLAPVFLTLLAIMSMELVSIFAVTGHSGLRMNLPKIIFFAMLGMGFTTLLWFYFSSVKRAAWAHGTKRPIETPSQGPSQTTQPSTRMIPNIKTNIH
jgi:hypothetical protein